jgi:hypothetical protein
MLTRRQLLALGATACLAAVLGDPTSATATGPGPAVAAYLRRAPWLPLVGGAVSISGVTLWLAEVGNLPHLADRDDAFRLEFTGPPGALPSATHLFGQPALGSFVMFISPVDTVAGTDQRYEVVVDRSVGVASVVQRQKTERASQGSSAQPKMAS